MKYLILFLSLTNMCYATNNIFDYDFNLEDNKVEPVETKPVENTPIEVMPTVVANKKTGTISVFFPESGKTEIGYALYGRQTGDSFDMTAMDIPTKNHPPMTPAGTYQIKRVFSWRLNQEILAFVQGADKILAIHAVWMGNPKQHRVQRLLSPTPDDNRITNGCINVDPTFFLDVLSKVPDGATLTVLPEIK